MSSDVAISVRGLSKAYTINREERHATLGETLLAKLKRPFKRPERENFMALQDISFDVKKGDVVGIVGRNGAGKSTLLKILSRITEPTTGSIDLWGRVGSLLEVGTGFHPELTGRENIFLNGQILGMRKKEIQKSFDAIVDFAEVEKFLDTPVKRYSSGMYVRLAFAVAAHLNPEILVVDEVLAVGDMEFQSKCLGKMRDIASGGGRTVLFVSHNLSAIESLTNRCVYLRQGKIQKVGPTAEIIESYVNDTRHTSSMEEELSRAKFTKARLKDLIPLGADGSARTTFRPGEEFSIEFVVEVLEKSAVDVAIVFENQQESPLFTSHFSDHAGISGDKLNPGIYRYRIKVTPAQFRSGHFKASLAVFHPQTFELYQTIHHLPIFAVEGTDADRSFPKPNDPRWGALYFPFHWEKLC